MKIKVKAVLFDLDDTLYPQHQYVQGAYLDIARWVSQHCNIDSQLIFNAMFQRWKEMGSRYAHIFSETLDRLGVERDSLVEQMVDLYRNHKPQLRPFPEVMETLDLLRRRFKLGIVTDGHPATQRSKISALGIQDYFDVLVFTGDRGKDFYKPNPNGYQEALHKLSLVSSEAVFVGDQPSIDLQGAKEIGLFTIWICRDGNPAGLETRFVDFPINDFKKLIPLLD